MTDERDETAEALADLVQAAKEDQQLQQQLNALLRLPQAQREPLVATALNEMTLRGEPAWARRAFAALMDENVAHAVQRALE